MFMTRTSLIVRDLASDSFHYQPPNLAPIFLGPCHKLGTDSIVHAASLNNRNRYERRRQYAAVHYDSELVNELGRFPKSGEHSRAVADQAVPVARSFQEIKFEARTPRTEFY